MTKDHPARPAGETLPTPPIWMMRQAGRYLPEYRATRAQAGDFLKLCYNPDLAAEVTLQPIRRFGFDAAILFADILLLPQALGADLWFETGEGPRLSTITTMAGVHGAEARRRPSTTPWPRSMKPCASWPANCPRETTLIGFAGAPWTVATYMIAGRGTPDQGPAHALKAADRATFSALIDRDHRGDDRLPVGAGAGRGRGGQAVRLLGRLAEGAGFHRFRREPHRPDHRRAEGPPPRPADHRLPARGGRRLHRLCPRDRGRLRGAGQFGHARNGRRRTCRWMAACRATSRRITWSPAVRRWWTRPAAWSSLPGRAAYLQPRPRHHPRRQPRQRDPDDRDRARRLKAKDAPGAISPGAHCLA